jgi:hypothetical protein
MVPLNSPPPQTLTGSTSGYWDINGRWQEHPTILYSRAPYHVSYGTNPVWRIPCEDDKEVVAALTLARRAARRPRLGVGAKPTKRWVPRVVMTAPPPPPVTKRADRGASRMRGGRLRHFFKRLRHTTGRMKARVVR